jgi:cytochrome c biogenesis protein CcdA
MTAALLLSLLGIAIVDSLNPALFVAQFYLLTTPRPVPRILSYIAGVLVVNFGGGLLILGGMRQVVANILSGVSPVVLHGAQFVLGLGLVLFGLWFTARPAETEAKQPRSLRPLHTFALGMVVMLNEITTALPYFIAIERIAGAGLDLFGNLLALLLYNAVFALPLFAFLILLVLFRQRFAAQLGRVTRAVQVWTPRVVKYGSLALGAFLVINGAASLASGAGLFG